LTLKGQPRFTAAVAAAPVVAASAAVVKKPAATAKPTTATTAKKEDPAKKKVIKGGGGGDKKPNVEKEEPDLSQETVDDKTAELFTPEVCTSLANNNWKDRLTAIETITTVLKRMPSDELPVQIVIRLINKKPGLKDTHPQVLKAKLDLVVFLASEAKFTQRSVQYCVADISVNIGDAKTSQQAKESLSKIAECIGLQNLLVQVLPLVFEAKSPKNQEHALLWLIQAIRDFGFANIEMKGLIAYLKTALANSNAAVRVAAIQLIGTLYMYVGPNIRVLFEGEKPALLEQIDNEIGKVKDEKAPAPVRRKKGDKVDNGAVGGDDGDEVEQQQQPQQDLMPRVDISEQITEELIAQLIDKNWKERLAGLEKVESILKDAKFIEANLGDLPIHLGKRVMDSNKPIAQMSLKICEKLAEAMGINGKKYCSVLAPGLIQVLSDSKEALRKLAIGTLNAWVNNCGGLAPFLEGEMMVESFGSNNPNLKAELCGWLASVLPKSKKLGPELKAIIGPVFICLEDRSQEVRTQALSLVEPLMQQVGPNEMLRVLGKTKVRILFLPNFCQKIFFSKID
jgi:cytoskeleton-associated protein 5